MSGIVGDLTAEQNEKLELFRTAVDDVLMPEHNDYFLLRWLRARNFDVVAAEGMLRKNLQWKQQLGVESIIDEYEPPEVLKHYYPGGLVGHDKSGSPVWIIPLGNLDIKGMFHSTKKTDFVRYTIRFLQQSEEDMNAQSERLGKVIETHTWVLDMENFSMKQITWGPAVDMVTHLVQMFEDNYPERLKKIYVVNAPKYFHLAYALVKPFLADETAKKICVYGTAKDIWKDKLLDEMDDEELPRHWGGTKIDPVDGNPRCPSLVCLGGAVPCSHYTAPSRRLSIDQSLDTVVVEKKSASLVEVVVEEPRSMIRWEFKTETNDIGFSVYRQRGIEELEGPHSGDDEEVIVALQRVNCHLVPEDGLVVVEKAGKYVLKFDNTYSWYRNKRVMYSVQVIPPSNAKSGPSLRNADPVGYDGVTSLK